MEDKDKVIISLQKYEAMQKEIEELKKNRVVKHYNYTQPIEQRIGIVIGAILVVTYFIITTS